MTMINNDKKLKYEVIITEEEIDEISLIVSHAYTDIYEGICCRLDNHEIEYIKQR